MKKWEAVIDESPDPDPEYREDPQDWKLELRLVDEDSKRAYEEVIYITFTGTVDDDGNVTGTPEEQVNDRIGAMLDGLNKSLKEESK